MFKKIFKFLFGYVIIEIVGKNKERFINECLEKGIYLFDVVPGKNSIGASVLNEDFKRIRPISRKYGLKIKILSKCGMSQYVKEHGRRIAFIVSGVLVCSYLAIVPEFIWCIEIEGVKNADIDNIKNILYENNVYIGARKKNIAKLSDIKNALIYGDEEINWAWLYLEGAKARLVIQEMTPPPEIIDKKSCGDIIAACDGYVTKAEVKRGERRVNKGQTVSKGQVLVSGKVAVFHEGYDEKYSYVRPQAEIIADTIRKETGEFSDREILRIKTGNKKRKLFFEIFGKEYCPFGDYKNVYDQYEIQTSNFDLSLPFIGYLGLSVGVHEVWEINETEHMLSEDEVLDRAKEALEERICKKIGINAVKKDDELIYDRLGDTYKVTLKMNFKENIGIEIPTEE